MDSLPVTPTQDALTVRRLRLGIGVIGIALPFVLTIGNALFVGRLTVLHSISTFYYTDMRDVFVGSMCAIGVFLVCYRYARLDDVLSTIAGVLAIVVALLPAAPKAPTSTDEMIGWAHQVSAAALFLLLAGFCLVLFTRTDPARVPLTPEKRGRDGIYRTCGMVILAAIALGLASNALPESTQDSIKPLFWCESVAVLAFGVAWLVKGQAIIKDSRGGGPVGGGSTAVREPLDDSASATGG